MDGHREYAIDLTKLDQTISLAHGLTLVTHNSQEFKRVPGLKVEDWELGL